ncbi:MAG: signal peptidase I [Candidatus Aminicenantes bacterium]|nr:signal peptidase I [Candidatus Aminicenantes bacterium]
MISLIKGRSAKYILLNIFSAAIVSLLLFIYLFSPYKVVGNSMNPVLDSGDKVLITNSFLTGEIRRFDIVVTKSSSMKRGKLIKRVIGLPGESIEIRNGNVIINNTLLNESFLRDKGDVIFRSLNMKLENIPDDYYFLLGDYRENSTDSRNFGPLHRKNIIGKTLIRYWPLKKFGFIK